VKALTIKQPWASLVANGAKDIENRQWHTNLRGIIAVHSSAKMAKADMEDACDLMEGFIPKFSRFKFQQDEFPAGSILGIVEIVDCVRSSDSPWFVGDYGFVLKNSVQFDEPIPCRGALGFWEIPEDILYLCRAQYRKTVIAIQTHQ
jgi:hypothetical protein